MPTDARKAMIEAIEDPRIRVVSFGLFDTLVRRRVMPPDHVLWFVAETLARRRGLTDETRSIFEARLKAGEIANRLALQRGREESTLEEIHHALADLLPGQSTQVREIMSMELDAERDLLEPCPLGRQLYGAALSAGKRVSIASDHYLPIGFLEQMLAGFGYVRHEAFFLSGDVGLQKASGNLYEWMPMRLGVDRGEILHIGANPRVDVEMARRKGLWAQQMPVSAMPAEYPGRDSAATHREGLAGRLRRPSERGGPAPDSPLPETGNRSSQAKQPAMGPFRSPRTPAPGPGVTHVHRNATAAGRDGTMTGQTRIALVSKADARGGGASRVADDIHAGLGGADGFLSDRFVGKLTPLTPEGYRQIVSRAPKLVAKLRRRAARRGWVDHTPFELPFLDPGIRRADIVHAHDISTVLAPLTLDRLARGRRRVIWTLHDMSALTGGCIYPLGCSAWRDRCGSCPMLGQWPLPATGDRTGEMQDRRLSVLAAGRVELVSPSRWLADLVAVRVPGAQVRVIPNGVDIDIFRPAESPPPADGTPRMLFIANHLHDLRKGGPYVSEIRRHLERTGRRLELILVGGGNSGELVEMGPLALRCLGRFDERTAIAAAYRRAEALLLPTHADNFPLVALEAMACGLPVFAFDTGGIREAVDAEVGSVVGPGEIDLLLEEFLAARAAGALPALGHAARARVEARYSMARFIEAHRALYAGVTSTETDESS